MRFLDTATESEQRFSVGRDLHTGRYYLSIPVSNRLCDYEEYYEIDRAAHHGYPGNLAELSSFADRCRARLCDDLLLISVGSQRGVA